MLSSTRKKYLLIIYELGYTGEQIRLTDIAKALNVKKASVSNMLPVLTREHMIEKNENGNIVFTSEGAAYANDLYEKYLVLYQFFLDKLASTKENARDDAINCLCALSDENTNNMAGYILKEKKSAAV